jgi:hypothetical protein
MEKEFVPYELALRITQLGFDEPCLASWSYTYELQNYAELKLGYIIDGPRNYTNAPLYQQAFRWFREKYKFNHSIICHKHPFGTDDYQYLILLDEDEFVETGFNTYEEAELACLDKLIEIVEQSKSDL